LPWYFHWEKFYSINRRWLFYDNLCVIWFILGHIWTYFSWDLLYRLCITINIHACKYPALPMTFTATNIYARYKAYTVAPILTCTYICACCNDCCNPSRGKYYVAWRKKKHKTLQGERRHSFFREERWVTIFRKSRFPQRTSLAFHLDLPGVIGHSRCNGCGVSSACKPYAARCNVACCTCISSCIPWSGCVATLLQRVIFFYAPSLIRGAEDNRFSVFDLEINMKNFVIISLLCI